MERLSFVIVLFLSIVGIAVSAGCGGEAAAEEIHIEDATATGARLNSENQHSIPNVSHDQAQVRSNLLPHDDLERWVPSWAPEHEIDSQNRHEIVNGVTTGSSVPEIVRVQLNAGNSWSYCSGVVINNRTIMMAAHCWSNNFYDTAADRFTQIWRSNANNADLVLVFSDFASYHSDPAWNGSGNASDFAIIRLSEEMSACSKGRFSSAIAQPQVSHWVAGYGPEASEQKLWGVYQYSSGAQSSVLELESSVYDTVGGDSGGGAMMKITSGSLTRFLTTALTVVQVGDYWYGPRVVHKLPWVKAKAGLTCTSTSIGGHPYQYCAGDCASP